MSQPTGFDVSHYQPALTPERVAQLFPRPYTFAGIKMSEGTYQTDPHFAANRAALRMHAVPRWLYHEVTAHEAPSAQLYRIMSASGGILYPRERLALALGDFDATAATCRELIDLVHRLGPTKRSVAQSGEQATRWRPIPVIYANRSNFQTVYKALPGPRIVAAYPGPPVVECVIHQDANHDPATGGDHDVWTQAATDLMPFFRS